MDQRVVAVLLTNQALRPRLTTQALLRPQLTPCTPSLQRLTIWALLRPRLEVCNTMHATDYLGLVAPRINALLATTTNNLGLAAPTTNTLATEPL